MKKKIVAMMLASGYGLWIVGLRWIRKAERDR